eukprot:gene31960-39481_t
MRQQLWEVSGGRQTHIVHQLDGNVTSLDHDEEAQRYLADHNAALALSLLEAEPPASRSQRVEMVLAFRTAAGVSASGQLAAAANSSAVNLNSLRPLGERVYKTTRVASVDLDHSVIQDTTPIAEEHYQLLQVEEEISEFGYHPDVHPQAVASHATSDVIAEAVVI